MNVVCLAQREPVLVAKQCATIDLLSEGRLLPAFAVGSDRGTEWEVMGIDRKTRGARTNEALEIIHRLWTQDSVDFEGNYYRLRGARLSPKPAQTNLPMWIGGESEAAIQRTARYGTGWIGGTEPPSTAGPIVAAIKAALPIYGRTIDEDHYGAGFPYRFGKASDDCFELQRGLRGYAGTRKRDPLKYFAIGDADSIVERIAEYVQAGVWKFVLRPTGRDDEDMILQTRRLIDEVLPAIARHWPKPAGQGAIVDKTLRPRELIS
jgi:alkanesulfonate monooxygenase SsuD/methylene tetrahydromethanopterin reductase-like flavin-dependent oxidoreductase (luciferase family)